MPDGSTEPLDELHVRATEYTIGDAGPDAMPAVLPPSSGYTYAVELSADEAVDAGATEVRFDKPVITYVDDFLGFPVGERRPERLLRPHRRRVGRGAERPRDRDRRRAGGRRGRRRRRGHARPSSPRSGSPPPRWSSSPASTPRASGCGASRSSTSRRGTSTGPTARRRTPSRRPSRRRRPTTPRGRRRSASATARSSAATASGSARRCRSPGRASRWTTGATRSPGGSSKRALEIPLTPASVPASLRDVKLEIHVAGRSFTHQFGAAPEPALLVHVGRPRRLRAPDGRLAAGDDPHRLPLRRRQVRRAEGRWRRRSAPIGGAEFEGARGRMDFYLWRTTRAEAEASVGGFDARGVGLGGWTLDAHHLYDPRARTVHMGDGRRVSAEPIITGYAGHGAAAASSPARATEARPRRRGSATPTTSSSMPDGSVLVGEIVSRDVGRIRRIRPDGTIETYASGIGSPRGIALGPGREPLRHRRPNLGTVLADRTRRGITRPRRRRRSGPRGDGGPATSALAPAADRGRRRARRQRLHRRRQRGQAGRARRHHQRPSRAASSASPLGDGGPATQAQLGFVDGLAVGPSGELYIGHQDNGSGAGNRIRRVDVGGTITTVAGGGPDPDVLGDGGPGTQATIGVPRGMDVGPDGALYFAELRDGGRVRRLGPDGVITHVRRPQRGIRRRRPRRPRARPARRPRQRAGRRGGARRRRVRRPPRRRRTSPGSCGGSAGRCRSARRLSDPVPRRLAGVRVRRRRAARPHASTA